MKLPGREAALVEDAKVSDYLLAEGKGKSGFYLRFDFDAESLSAALWEHAQRCDVDAERNTPYGTRYELVGPLPAPDGRAPRVRSVWQMEEGHPRLITVHPD